MKHTILGLAKEENLNADQKVTLAWLRDETSRIIQEVISEMKCEQGIISCDWTKDCTYLFLFISSVVRESKSFRTLFF
jgi:hypothetical protein